MEVAGGRALIVTSTSNHKNDGFPVKVGKGPVKLGARSTPVATTSTGQTPSAPWDEIPICPRTPAE